MTSSPWGGRPPHAPPVDQSASPTATMHPTTVGEIRSHHLFRVSVTVWSSMSCPTAVTGATFSFWGRVPEGAQGGRRYPWSPYGPLQQAPSRGRRPEAQARRDDRARGRGLRARDGGALRRGAAGGDGRVPGPAGAVRHEGRARRDARRHAPRGVRCGEGGGQAHARPAPLRRPDHGWRGAPLRLGRRDEDRRGQDAGGDAAPL